MRGRVRELIIGQRFGRLTILRRAPANDSHNRSRWHCRCDCGNKLIVRADRLMGERTISCGCYNREQSRKRVVLYSVVHGEATDSGHSLEYRSWASMLSRCRCGPTDKNYKDYSGRGITVCERWRSDYAAFLADMGRKPGPEYTLDRIDNDKGYTPDNCRWATRSVQNSNQRRYRQKSVAEERGGIRL